MTPQRRLLLVLMTATLTSSFAVCLFPPFFPRLAEEKGATATIYGFVIGVNCLTSFLVTPMIGKNVKVLISWHRKKNTFVALSKGLFSEWRIYKFRWLNDARPQIIEFSILEQENIYVYFVLFCFQLPKVGVKFAMVTGMFMGGICCAISG